MGSQGHTDLAECLCGPVLSPSLLSRLEGGSGDSPPPRELSSFSHLWANSEANSLTWTPKTFDRHSSLGGNRVLPRFPLPPLSRLHASLSSLNGTCFSLHAWHVAPLPQPLSSPPSWFHLDPVSWALKALAGAWTLGHAQ